MTPEGIAQAINYFRQAIEIDPKYALAHAWLAEAYDKAYWYGYLPPADAMLKERVAAAEAVELDESLSQAHLALAGLYSNGWDLSKATTEARRAVEISPEDSEAHHRYAYCLILVGKPDEAIAEIQRARDLDPLNMVMNVDVGEILLYARHYDEAIEALKQAIEMDATRGYVHYDLAVAYEQKGMEQEAFAEQLKSEMLLGASPAAIEALKKAYAAFGLRGFWRKNLEITKEKVKRNYIAPIVIAKLHARVADADQAFYWLEKAYAEHAPSMVELKVDPMLDPLRSDRRYIDLLRRLGFQA